MAEGWTRYLRRETIEVYSAGIEKHGLNPRAVHVMSEAGVDISTHASKTLDELSHVSFEVVVTVCSHADQTCPQFTGAPRVMHVPFDDPPKLATSGQSEDEQLEPYRRVRNEIRDFVRKLPERLDQF